MSSHEKKESASYKSPSRDNAEDGTEMGGGSEEDEDMPDGMKIFAAVVGEEIRTHGVEETFGKDEDKGKVG